MELIFLMIFVIGYTPDAQIISRTVFIPFDTPEACYEAAALARYENTIGEEADLSACVSVRPEDYDRFMKETKSWPGPIGNKN